MASRERSEVKVISINSGAQKGNLRPLVIGNEAMGIKLHAFFMSSQYFSDYEMQSMFERNYTPNLVLVFGPLTELLTARLERVRAAMSDYKLLYFETLRDGSPESFEQGKANSERLGADGFLAREFISMENIAELIREVVSV